MKRKMSIKTFWYGISTRIRNYFLVKRFPFLKPSLGYSVNMYFWSSGYRYTYEETWLDALPKGWYKLALELCKELKKIIKEDNLNNYAIAQVKEKWGFLNWYDEGGNERTDELTRRYETLSRNTCINCGKTPTTYVTKGWITYICDDCAEKYYKDKPEKITKRKDYE